jgi:hypothetical protein
MSFRAAASRAEDFFKHAPVSTIAYSLVLCLVNVLVAHRFLVYRRLRHFKGPWLAAFSKLWMMKCTFAGTMHLDVADVCAQYGKDQCLRVTLMLYHLYLTVTP